MGTNEGYVQFSDFDFMEFQKVVSLDLLLTLI